MPLTRDEARALLVPKLTEKHRQALTWTQIAQALNNSDMTIRSLVTSLFRNSEWAADTMLTDDALSLADIERVLG